MGGASIRSRYDDSGARNKQHGVAVLEREPCVKLNLTAAANGAEYSSDVVDEVTRCIFENGVSVPSQRERALRITRHSKIRMIEKIVGFRSERNPRVFAQLEALLQHQIKLSERGAAQAIPSSGTELTGKGQRKCARIEPARRSTHSTTVRINAGVRIVNQVWSLRCQ
jgi:hypothetical protein